MKDEQEIAMVKYAKALKAVKQHIGRYKPGKNNSCCQVTADEAVKIAGRISDLNCL